MNTIDNLQQLYFDQLRDLYSAENQLVAALPEMVTSSTHSELRQAFSNHLDETRNHLDRLDEIFADHGISGDGEECDAMRGLILETRKHLAATSPGDVRDALLIACANRIEHYEIASYGVAKAFAQSLGFDQAAELLDETLQEEGEADKLLTKIATGGVFGTGINQEAIH